MVRMPEKPGYLWAADRWVAWPGVLHEIHEILGTRLTLRFLDAFGGGMVIIPETLGARSQLRAVLGDQIAEELVRRLHGQVPERCPIPTGDSTLVYAVARQMRAAGFSYPQIRQHLCRRFRIRTAERTLRKVCEGVQPGRTQPQLPMVKWRRQSKPPRPAPLFEEAGIDG